VVRRADGNDGNSFCVRRYNEGCGDSPPFVADFKDKPEDLYNRLRINVELSERLGVNIYSFPMKYHPITDPKWFSNRDFIGKPNWCRKYIRVVQCVLNSTHGKIGRGKVFFFKAFGRDEGEFRELLLMPEAFVVKRWDAEICGLKAKWLKALGELTPVEREWALGVVRENDFEPGKWKGESAKVREFLSFYTLPASEIPQATDEEKRRQIAQFESTCPTGVSEECNRLLALCN